MTYPKSESRAGENQDILLPTACVHTPIQLLKAERDASLETWNSNGEGPGCRHVSCFSALTASLSLRLRRRKADPIPRAESSVSGSWRVIFRVEQAGDHPIKLLLDFSKRKRDFIEKIYSIWEKGPVKPQKDNTVIQHRIKFMCHEAKPQSPLGTQLLFGAEIKSQPRNRSTFLKRFLLQMSLVKIPLTDLPFSRFTTFAGLPLRHSEH